MKNLYAVKKERLVLNVLFCLFLSFTGFAQVGIGTTNPNTALDVNGALSLREGQVLDLSNGINANIDLGSTVYSHYRITGPTADFEIRTFLTPTASAAEDGQILTLINTTSQSMKVVHELGSHPNVDRRISCPRGESFYVYGRNTSVTFQYNTNKERWFVISATGNPSSPPIDSVSLEEDIIISSNNYSNIAGMKLMFTARKPSVLVLLSASGGGRGTGNLSRIFLQVYNETASTIVGETNQNIQSEYINIASIILGNLYPPLSIPNWSTSFEKLLTGLTVGQTYTLQVKGMVLGEVGNAEAGINVSGDGKHLTLSVLQ